MMRIAEEEFDLDKLDAEMKMEKIRQTSSKLNWEGFHASLRRNLMEKRLNFDANDRIDVLNALAVMRKGLPVDENSDLTTKLRQLAEGLECQFTVQPGGVCIKNADLSLEVDYDEKSEIKECRVTYFGQHTIVSAELSLLIRMITVSEEKVQVINYFVLSDLIQKENWMNIRSGIHSVINSIPQCVVAGDRNAFAQSMLLFEQGIASEQSGNPSFDLLNSLPYGWIVARSALRPARLFYLCEPSYVNSVGRECDPTKDFEVLPHLEISFTHCDKEHPFPSGSTSDPWSSTRLLRGCYTLKLSAPMVFSAMIWRRLERYLAKPSVVRQHVNLYGYLSSFDLKNPSLILRSAFPADRVQHVYEMDVSQLREERDVIIGELHLKDGRELNKVLSLVRAQAQHNSFFESILAMCCVRARSTRATKIRLSAAAHCFEMSFVDADQLINVRLANENDGWKVYVDDSDGSVANDVISQKATDWMRHWSIPVMMSKVFTELGVRGEPVETFGVPEPGKAAKCEERDELMDTSSENSIEKPCDSDKIGSAWLPRRCLKSAQKRKRKRMRSPEFVFEIVDPELPDGQGRPAGLLAMFKELEEVQELIPPPSGRRLPGDAEGLKARINSRILSDNTLAKSAFSDLEAICQLADSVDEERGSPMSASGRYGPGSGQPTPSHMWPGPPTHMGAMGQPLSQSPLGHMRPPGGVTPQRPSGGMTPQYHLPPQSPLEAARQKMTMAVNSADVFDFPDERSNSSTGSFPSPLGSATQFGGFPGFPAPSSASPLSSATTPRGMVAKRRGRGRKSGNVGDREGSTTPQHALPGSTDPQRKTRGVRRPRGPRKTASSIEHLPYDQRPLLQRTFSDSQYGQPQTPASVTSSVEKSMDSPYVESESDDGETDPPPPPKTIFPQLQQMQQMQQQQQQQGQGQQSQQVPLHPLLSAPTPSATFALPPVPPAANMQAANTTPSNLTPSSNIITATVAPSPAALAAQQIEQPTSSSGVSASTPRKSSVDSIVPNLQRPKVPTKKSSLLSDLYDDGTGGYSPPRPNLSPANKPQAQSSPMRTPITSATTSAAESTPVPSTPNTSLTTPTTGTPSTPKDTSTPGAPPKESKLILKIPKAVSRASPALESMRKSSGGAPPMTKVTSLSEKIKEKKERKELYGPKSAKIAFEQRKRKLEGEKKETKRKKEEKEKDAATAPVNAMNPMQNFGMPMKPIFKNFKIPKKETTDAPSTSATEQPQPSVPTTPTASAPPPSTFGSRSGGDKREPEREREWGGGEREKKNSGSGKSLRGMGRQASSGPASERERPTGRPPMLPPTPTALIPNIPLPSGPPPPGPPTNATPTGPPQTSRKTFLQHPPEGKRPPLARGPPPTLSKPGGRWVPPPSGPGGPALGGPPGVPPATAQQRLTAVREPSPDPEAMQIDDSGSPDTLKIADE